MDNFNRINKNKLNRCSIIGVETEYYEDVYAWVTVEIVLIASFN